MREHLYRGKRKDNGEWVEGCLLIDYITGQYFIHAIGNCVNESDKVNEEGCLRFLAFEVLPETVGEYTGLTDKNGKKIFEGDIVKGEAEEPIGSVEWQQAECRYLASVRNEYDWLFMDDDKLCVIGNIYDNPDLVATLEKNNGN